ncbi:MAG: AAA family ATPase, partial [Thermoplasmata archaeon]|nr:AAA family ATPase [Thermoplasmata archaeon]
MGYKVAVAGKGGVGKTTVVGSLARIWAMDGMKVLAIDADPASHLHSILEIPAGSVPRPISEELDLREERTGARPGAASGPFYKLNPRVDDIPDRYSAVG